MIAFKRGDSRDPFIIPLQICGNKSDVPGVFLLVVTGLELEAPSAVLSMPRTFEEAVLPHLDAAFNYARWLTNNDSEAEDVVQDASLRAFRFFSTLRGRDARPWLLAIVRNAWYGRAAARKPVGAGGDLESAEHVRAEDNVDPEALMMRRETVEDVRRAIAALPADFREVLVLRELESMSYKEIADVIGAPIGTVMSRLSRARERLVPLLGAHWRSAGERS
jgi:RNA polymerase sigma-70 factor, ECF subfamily